MALSLVTWNLNGLEPRDLDARTEAACLHLLLRDDPPDVVAVQEVVDRTWHAHLLPHFSHAGYAALPGRADSEYWCALFVRGALRVEGATLERLPDSGQGRALLEATVTWEGQRTWIATGHLESLRSGAPTRKRQLHHVLDRLEDPARVGRAVFAGDTNLRDAEVAEVAAARELPVLDAWEQVGTKATRDTWRAPGSGGRRGRGFRFDRVLMGAALRAERVWLLGDVPVADIVGTLGAEAGAPRCLPSDHLALGVTLRS